MGKYFIKFAILFIFQFSYGQQMISFNYDASGNQTTRTVCMGCGAKQTYVVKEVSQLKENDFQKFEETDNFSYYPNPVKNELYLKWELLNRKNVYELNLFSVTGALLKTFKNLTKKNTEIIQFENYPNGNYLLEVKYDNGEVKVIKIIK